ncbi:SGNH/GDSL hydrolase family protein [Candidatus Marinimicrobia bacterium]|nr:SGNH/GDSL hydrolase family protein [Candidatus Neomarinimicrobiota bacterium]
MDTENQENLDWPNLKKYRQENHDLSSTVNSGKRIVFMGDSITEGWSGLYPDFFENKDHINRGISGQTTPQMLIRFKPDVIDLSPSTVVILAGTNDIAENTGPSNVKMITDNIFSMADLASAHKIDIILCSVLPVYEYTWKKILDVPSYIYEVNTMLKDYCTDKSLRYIDYFSAMANEKKGLGEDLSEDGVHPNEKGYKIMSRVAESILYSK